jgi:hypothetical protein
MPLASVQCFAEATHAHATIAFYVLTEALGLITRHWRWVPDLLSDDQKTDRARQAIMLLATLMAAENRRWLNFWIGHESRIM